ncbi:MAG: TatD family hydrolase [Tannerella sp.]|jgi:TatD DNase family protein|nr:TatD family hydrolase [Tannerella sp.]
MIFYDIHSHQLFDNKDIVTIKSIDLGVVEDIVPIKDEIIHQKDALFSVGIHPWNPDRDKILELRELLRLENVVAIGEAGLDKLKPDLTIQRQLFEIQAQIAEETGKPLIIHCVKAWSELLETKKRLKPSTIWIVHGFRGGEKLAEQLIDAGMYLSFGAFFNPESLKKAWQAKRLFVETDDKPIDIQDVYAKISKTLSISPAELSGELAKNFYLCALK